MQKYFTLISTDKKGYGLSMDINKMNNERYNKQNETRRMWKKNSIHAEWSKAGNFFEKIWNKVPKIRGRFFRDWDWRD